MPYESYNDKHRSDTYDNAYKRVKALWTLARREFGIKMTYDVVFAVLNEVSIAKLPHPHSHVVPRSGKPPAALLRVSKDEMDDTATLMDRTLPREMAHLVCKINPTLGNPYTKTEGWHKVYEKLGGVY